MSNVMHYARVRKYMDETAIGEGNNADQREAAALEAQLATSTALREITQAISNGFRDINNRLLDPTNPDALVEITDQHGGVVLVVNRDHVETVRTHEDGALIIMSDGQQYVIAGRTVAQVSTEVAA